MSDKFHQGELAVQKMTGEQQIAKMVSRGIMEGIPWPAARFIEKQVTAFIATTDEQQRVWLSLLVGEPDFLEILSEKELVIHREKIISTSQSIFYQLLREEKQVGLLFMEPRTRRRFRVNGTVDYSEEQLKVTVQEAYGNCPKYIQKGNLSLPDDETSLNTQVYNGEQLGDYEKYWIKEADTFYVATQSLTGKTDASHRGGNKGFVEILEDGTLKIPDYPGNSMFNTLGNIYENPNTGLLFVNFATGETLQLTGKGSLHFDQTKDEDLLKTGETGRYWLFKTEAWIRTRHHHQTYWEFLEYSPFNPSGKKPVFDFRK